MSFCSGGSEAGSLKTVLAFELEKDGFFWVIHLRDEGFPTHFGSEPFWVEKKQDDLDGWITACGRDEWMTRKRDGRVRRLDGRREADKTHLFEMMIECKDLGDV